jgi:hypothetical protein
MKQDQVLLNVRTGGKGEAYLIIWYRDGRKHFHLFGGGHEGVATEGSFSEEKSMEEIIGRILKQHYEPRIYSDLNGNTEECAPLYDDPKIFPEAIALKERLVDIAAGQLQMF